MEPTLHAIEDYNGNESLEKRKTVNLIIAGLFLAGVIYAGVKSYFDYQSNSLYVPAIEKKL